jgi:uncharacterized repeat protein (TIGR01451 family)
MTIEVGAGTYTAKCKNTCSTSENSNIVEVQSGGTPDAPTVVTDKLSLCGADSATIKATVCSGTAKWSTGVEGATLVVKTPGTYTATCTNACGTSLTSFPSIVITSGGKPSAPKLSSDKIEICEGTSTVINAVGCSGTIKWSTNQTGSSITISQTGSYTATCTNACGVSDNSEALQITRKLTGCSSADTCKIDAPIILASKMTLCTAETITLTAAGCSGTVIWSNGKTGNSVTARPSVTTTYNAICKVGTCNSPISQSLTISIGKTTKPIITCSTDLVCEGESVTLKAYNCGGIITWSNGQSGEMITVTPTTSSKYTAICSIGSCISDNADSLAIAVGPPNKPFVTCKNSIVCLGETSTLVASGCTGLVIWSNGTQGTVLNVTATEAKKYTYTAVCRSVGGKCTSEVSNAVSITVGNKLPTPDVLVDLKNICPFETVDLNNALMSDVSTAANSFEFHATSSPSSSIITTPGMVQSGTYYLFERSSIGCYSDPAAVKATVTKCDNGVGVDTTKNVDIAVTITANSEKVPVGEAVVYKIVAKNVGRNKATNVVIRNLLPNGLTYKVGSLNMEFENGTITAKASSMNVGDSLVFNYTAEVTAPGKIVNKAEL